MPLLPIRMVFRNRWMTLVWAGGICLTAASFAGGDAPSVEAANAVDSNLAQAAALLAEP